MAQGVYFFRLRTKLQIVNSSLHGTLPRHLHADLVVLMFSARGVVPRIDQRMGGGCWVLEIPMRRSRLVRRGKTTQPVLGGAAERNTGGSAERNTEIGPKLGGGSDRTAIHPVDCFQRLKLRNGELGVAPNGNRQEDLEPT